MWSYLDPGTDSGAGAIYFRRRGWKASEAWHPSLPPPRKKIMVCNRVWSMPSKWTFQVKPLLDLVMKYKNGGKWIDPFAGMHSPAEVTNDLNPKCPTLHHMEALDFMLEYDGPFDGAIFDPPYSLTQVSRSYLSLGLKFHGKENPTGGFPLVRDRIAQVVKPRGVVISFGWNTVGMGKTRNFEPIEYLICSHGGNRNDTLVVVEQKRESLPLLVEQTNAPTIQVNP